MSRTIYRTSPGGQDVPVATSDAPTAVMALEAYAEKCDIRDFSIDSTSQAYWLCPANSRHFYYSYRGCDR